MSLSPELEIIEMEDSEQEIETSRTFAIDFENGRIKTEKIDGIEAIKQFVVLAIRTRRYVHPIYSSQTGSEIEELIKDTEATIDYKKAELPRLITEALIYDDRIDNVGDFEIEHIDNAFHVYFTVTVNDELIEFEEVF